MKKNTLKEMLNYLNGETVDVPTLRGEIERELEKLNEKTDKNQQWYRWAKPLVLGAMSEEPMTVAEIADKLGNDEIPKSKIQYGLLHDWANEIVKIENGKNPNTYCLM